MITNTNRKAVWCTEKQGAPTCKPKLKWPKEKFVMDARKPLDGDCTKTAQCRALRRTMKYVKNVKHASHGIERSSTQKEHR